LLAEVEATAITPKKDYPIDCCGEQSPIAIRNLHKKQVWVVAIAMLNDIFILVEESYSRVDEVCVAIANRSPLQPQFSTSDRCTPGIAHALQRVPNSKLKSPHLNYSLFANVE